MRLGEWTPGGYPDDRRLPAQLPRDGFVRRRDYRLEHRFRTRVLPLARTAASAIQGPELYATRSISLL